MSGARSPRSKSDASGPDGTEPPMYALEVTPEPTPVAPRILTPVPPAASDRPSHDFGALASSVTDGFKGFSFGADDWYVDLSAPHRATSAGEPGPLLQHLRVRPRKPAAGRSTIVAGTVHPIDNRAELRDYDHVSIAHELRFRRSLPISAAEWESLLRKAEVVLNGADIQSLRTPPTREMLDQRRNLERMSKGAISLFVVIVLLVMVVAWRVVAALV